MNTALFHLTALGALAVLIVLCLGLYTMATNKSANLSQKIMRWRVGLQFLTILIIVGYIFTVSA